jgi:hypothetical protein
MINLNYSLIIEATTNPNSLGFYSPKLEGFSGVGRSIEDFIAKSRVAMEEPVRLLEEAGLPVSCN